MGLKAIFLNCTLKKSPEESNTAAMIEQSAKIFRELGVKTEVIRVVDHNVKFGNETDMGEGDDWPKIWQQIKQADMFIVATPIWRGDRSSISKIVAERLDGVWAEADDDTGRYPTYNKIGGVLVDGNEDGAKTCISRICFDLSEHGFCVPPNNHAYWVGPAGPGKSYKAAGGEKYFFTNQSLLYMAHNMVYFAQLLKDNPITTNLKELNEKAKSMSDD